MINGQILRDALVSGANLIANHRQQVDALNVFPVPDGDTGTNMSMTIGAAKRELVKLADNTGVGEVASVAASALLRGARGNSGVITSLLFRGFAKGLQGKETANAADMVSALRIGVESAYKAVMKPTEGTMLTVARLAGEHAGTLDTAAMEVDTLWAEVLTAAAAALEQTPEMLPVLKKAGVVDAGGKGLLFIFEGMQEVFCGRPMVESGTAEAVKAEDDIAKNAAAEYEGEITFTYCTEFLVLKCPEKEAHYLKLRAYLESIGDSAVVVEDDELIKCHVHTDNPGNALQEALKHGDLTGLKIENMREQQKHNQAEFKKAVHPKTEADFVPAPPQEEYGFVAVAAGDGVKQLFVDLGVTNVVTGGQTMNPSTDDILRAIEATPAKKVFVLPNNKNIIMAAEQTIGLASREVHVLPTRTIPQGLAAMLVFNPDDDAETNLIAMGHAADKVGTGQITFAARDSDFDGHKIKQGEILAMENGRLSFTDKDITKAAVKLAKQLIKKNTTFITLIYGEDISEEHAQTILAAVRDKVPADIEVVLVPGGQPVYYLMISAE